MLCMSKWTTLSSPNTMPQVHQIEPIQAHDSLLLSPGWSPQSSRAEPRKLTNHILFVQVTRFPSKDASVNHVEKVHVVLRKWKQQKKHMQSISSQNPNSSLATWLVCPGWFNMPESYSLTLLFQDCIIWTAGCSKTSCTTRLQARIGKQEQNKLYNRRDKSSS